MERACEADASCEEGRFWQACTPRTFLIFRRESIKRIKGRTSAKRASEVRKKSAGTSPAFSTPLSLYYFSPFFIPPLCFIAASSPSQLFFPILFSLSRHNECQSSLHFIFIARTSPKMKSQPHLPTSWRGANEKNTLSV